MRPTYNDSIAKGSANYTVLGSRTGYFDLNHGRSTMDLVKSYKLAISINNIEPLVSF